MTCDTGWWFSAGTTFSSANKTDHHDTADILLKVAFNTTILTLIHIEILAVKLKFRLLKANIDQKIETCWTNWTDLLHKQRSKDENPLVSVTEYNPAVRKLIKSIGNKYLNTVLKSFYRSLIITYRKTFYQINNNKIISISH